ncbi:hypothetical protein FKM82_000468 [Ascaphus truei]
MKTLLIMTAVIIFLFWLTDTSEGFGSGNKSKLRRAFFSKRSIPSNFEENTRYNCVIRSCDPGPEECTMSKVTRNSYQQIDDVKREIQKIRRVIHFGVCAAKCLNNWEGL